MDKEYVFKSDKGYRVYDRFMELWLRSLPYGNLWWDMEFIWLKHFLWRGYLVLSFDIIIYCYRCSDKEKNDS